jgi:hypothetical protein
MTLLLTPFGVTTNETSSSSGMEIWMVVRALCCGDSVGRQLEVAKVHHFLQNKNTRTSLDIFIKDHLCLLSILFTSLFH